VVRLVLKHGVPGGSVVEEQVEEVQCQPVGSGNTPPVAPPQGNPGGHGLPSPQGAGAPYRVLVVEVVEQVL
jgi:hypothetical protein